MSNPCCTSGGTNGGEYVSDTGETGDAGRTRVGRIRRPTPLNLGLIEQHSQLHAVSSAMTLATLRAVRARRRVGNRFVWMLNDSPVSVVCT